MQTECMLRIGLTAEGSFVEEEKRTWVTVRITWMDVPPKICYDMYVPLNNNDDENENNCHFSTKNIDLNLHL